MKAFLKFVQTDFFFTSLLIVIAAIPRILLLGTFPPGLHGDEAWSGIDAERILNTGFIGPYVPSALGQPTGPLYFTAVLFNFFGISIFILRLSMTIFGIFTIPFFYSLLRFYFSKSISFFVALSLTFSLIHLHYSRTAFMLISAPLFAVATLLLLVESYRNKSLLLAAIAGIFAGLGVYSYNSYPLFMISIFIGLVFLLIKERFSAFYIKYVLSFTFCFLIIASPLLSFILMNPQTYFAHHSSVAFFDGNQVAEQKTTLNKTELITMHAVDQIRLFFIGHRADLVDGFGGTDTFGLPYLAVMGIGVVGIVKNRSKFGLYIIASIPILLLGTVFGYDATYRRGIIAVPYLCFLLAYGFFYLQNLSKSRLWKVVIIVAMINIICVQSAFSLYYYFFDTTFKDEMSWTYDSDLTRSIMIVKKLNTQNANVYLFSSRWGCQYETIRFLLPNITCQDRSAEFGHYSFEKIEKGAFIVLVNKYVDKKSLLKPLYTANENKVLENNTVIADVFQIVSTKN